ncbi:site-specific integrase [Pseudomonas sp. RL_5y_Pfl2_69]|uniref:site-specific integrase n=1 Tax=Pseudomonas sp. RL_5y_Pfl2_69 TaxID=3088711 RepID=UPI0030DB9DB5
MKQPTIAQPIIDAHESNTTVDRYIVRPEDIALDLDATARSAANGRVFWEGEHLIHLGYRNIDCELLLSNLSSEVKESFKKHVLSFADSQRFSLTVVMHLVSAFCTASKGKPPSIFDTTWVTHVVQNASVRTRTFQARIFLDYWKDRYPNAATDDALNLLAQIAPPPCTSNNVESDDPEKSWLTDEEYDDILIATWNNYELTGSTQPALIRLLALQYARRPSQISALKFGDLKSGSMKAITQLHENEIHFPSVKEQGVETEFRGGKFEIHPIADHLWNMLMIQRQEIIAAFEVELGSAVPLEEIDKLPIFTTHSQIIKAFKILSEILDRDPLINLDDELFHLRAQTIGRVIQLNYNFSIKSLRARLPVRPDSHRTGKPLVFNAIRLRHTRARKLARMGVPKPILSYWLGHNHGEAIDSYYNDPAEEARKLNERMSPGLVPIAQAFHGRIIATDAEATYPDNPLKSLEFAKDGWLKNIGRCGRLSFCTTSSIPLPCYRCRSFEPLVDAPHEEVLKALQFRQAQENEIVKLGNRRDMLIPIDLSDDIRAVERCIQLCKIKREQK